jgi:hypothetical protein
MPTMPEVLAKGPILINLDRVLSNRSKRARLKTALRNPALSLEEIAATHEIALTQEERDHLQQHWFGENDNGGEWWPGAQPVSRILRPALSALIQKLDETGLPADCYWVCDPGHGQHEPGRHDYGEPHEPQEEIIEATTSWTNRQVTFIIFTPHPPRLYDPHPDSVEENILITKIENGAVVTERVMRHP